MAHMREKRNADRVLWGNVKGRYHSDNPDTNERIILKWI
jgi:hypothetical protein